MDSNRLPLWASANPLLRQPADLSALIRRAPAMRSVRHAAGMRGSKNND
jgi:hypothetical protein